MIIFFSWIFKAKHIFRRSADKSKKKSYSNLVRLNFCIEGDPLINLFISSYSQYAIISLTVCVRALRTNEVQNWKVGYTRRKTVVITYTILRMRPIFNSVMRQKRLRLLPARMRSKLISVLGRKANFPANYQAQQGENVRHAKQKKKQQRNTQPNRW